MVDYIQLARVNNILADKTGRLADGSPAFRFMRTGELKFPIKTGTETVTTEGGVALVRPTFEMRPQMPGQEDTWCLARWIKPPDRQTWERDFPTMDYPANGYWFCVTPLRPGKEPTEDWARFVADQVNWQRELTYSQTLELIESHNQRVNDANDSEMRASVRDCFVNHVPGARGGSYISFNESSQGSGNPN